MQTELPFLVSASHIGMIEWRGTFWQQHDMCCLYRIWQNYIAVDSDAPVE